MKNVTQFFVIAAIAAAVPVAAGVEAAALGEAAAVVGAAADVVAAAVADGEAGAELLLELLEQAVIVAASASPSTGTSRAR